MNSYTPYLKILKRVKSQVQSGLREHLIRCEVGEWLDCAVFKLQKKSWTKGGLGEGVFFSVWAGEKELRKGQFNYNIHALKMRFWEDHAIKPGEFAEAFRSKFGRFQKRWPNVRTDYGPQTLMQGSLELNSETFERKVLELVGEFTKVYPIIDQMIAERKKVQL